MPNDNVDVENGAFTEIVAADDIGNVKYQRVKTVFGADGEWSDVSHETPYPVLPLASRTPSKMISRFLDKDGDGGGDKAANEDYSVTPQSFSIQPPSTKIYNITELHIQVNTALAVSALDAETYGEAGTLTNGICIRLLDQAAAVIKDILDGQKVKGLEDLFLIASRADASPPLGVNAAVTATIKFLEDWKIPLRIDGSQSEKLDIFLNDDFSALRGHRFLVKGYMEDVPA